MTLVSHQHVRQACVMSGKRTDREINEDKKIQYHRAI